MFLPSSPFSLLLVQIFHANVSCCCAFFQDLIRKLLLVDPARRMTATQAVEHPWLLTTGEALAQRNLGKNLEQLRIFNATRKLRAAIQSVSRREEKERERRKVLIGRAGRPFETTYSSDDLRAYLALKNVSLTTPKQ